MIVLLIHQEYNYGNDMFPLIQFLPISMRNTLLALVIFTSLLCSTWATFGDKAILKEKDMMRKIVFDKKTPDVFYCPMQKPSSMNKIIVT